MFRIEIHVKGKLDPNWAGWFEGVQVQANSSGETVLTGNLPDKSAVYGIISRLSSLGITLLSVICEEVRSAEPEINT